MTEKQIFPVKAKFNHSLTSFTLDSVSLTSLSDFLTSNSCSRFYKNNSVRKILTEYLDQTFRLPDTQSRVLRTSNTDLRIPLFKTSS